MKNKYFKDFQTVWMIKRYPSPERYLVSDDGDKWLALSKSNDSLRPKIRILQPLASSDITAEEGHLAGRDWTPPQ